MLSAPSLILEVEEPLGQNQPYSKHHPQKRLLISQAGGCWTPIPRRQSGHCTEVALQAVLAYCSYPQLHHACGQEQHSERTWVGLPWAGRQRNTAGWSAWLLVTLASVGFLPLSLQGCNGERRNLPQIQGQLFLRHFMTEYNIISNGYSYPRMLPRAQSKGCSLHSTLFLLSQNRFTVCAWLSAGQNSNLSISEQPTEGRYQQKQGKAQSPETLQSPNCWLAHKSPSIELSQTLIGISVLVSSQVSVELYVFLMGCMCITAEWC